MDLTIVQRLNIALRDQIHRIVIGQDSAIDFMMVALLSEGHVLLEGPPGTAKTLLVRSFAAGLALQFGRVQFTPDLMPGDVIGTNLFNFQTNEFALVKGPIFTQLLLADEINRTPPKTQAALLEAMQERSVTIDGTSHPLGSGFMVIATQNPVEHEGTYPLPEAQLDRFLFKIGIDYPSLENEREIVKHHGARIGVSGTAPFPVTPIADLSVLTQARQAVQTVQVSDAVLNYIVDIIRATREKPSLAMGASPRAAAMLCSGARSYAAMQGRDFVIPDDVKTLAIPALRHRVLLAPGAEIDQATPERTLRQILEQIPAPR